MPISDFRGNPRHLAILIDALDKGDISEWNAFVRKNGPSFHARLAGADLAGRKLSEANLSGADLSDANLSAALLIRADLSNARIRGANLSDADLSGVRMNRAILTDTDLENARMTDIRARGADFHRANLSGAILKGADLTDASMDGASMTGTSRKGAKMKVRVKVRSKASDGPTDREDEEQGPLSPWIMALDEEARLKEMRKIREEKKKAAEQLQLDKKLGKRRPLFNRIK